ncbi:hypothetical protein KIL84_022398 [Mauremys mutica]|uniref:Uncharacterized protein n=1 Tax=Mauremys mutica TaxID=74926 RepID=A0A9D4AZ64_9SAUR|nr:hypothetical protein KIL84_022398 [Mauremys mutica]
MGNTSKYKGESAYQVACQFPTEQSLLLDRMRFQEMATAIIGKLLQNMLELLTRVLFLQIDHVLFYCCNCNVASVLLQIPGSRHQHNQVYKAKIFHSVFR